MITAIELRSLKGVEQEHIGTFYPDQPAFVDLLGSLVADVVEDEGGRVMRVLQRRLRFETQGATRVLVVHVVRPAPAPPEAA